MEQQKFFLVPAFMIVEAGSAERADMIACAVTETLNDLPHGHGYARLRLDEGVDTIEQPADFPGESLLQLPGIESPTAGAEILAAVMRIKEGLDFAQPHTGFGLELEIELAQDIITKLEGGDSGVPAAGEIYAAPRRQYREPGSLVVTVVEPREGDDPEYWAVYRKAPAGDEWGDEWVADFREQAAAEAYCKAFAA